MPDNNVNNIITANKPLFNQHNVILRSVVKVTEQASCANDTRVLKTMAQNRNDVKELRKEFAESKKIDDSFARITAQITLLNIIVSNPYYDKNASWALAKDIMESLNKEKDLFKYRQHIHKQMLDLESAIDAFEKNQPLTLEDAEAARDCIKLQEVLNDMQEGAQILYKKDKVLPLMPQKVEEYIQLTEAEDLVSKFKAQVLFKKFTKEDKNVVKFYQAYNDKNSELPRDRDLFVPLKNKEEFRYNLDKAIGTLRAQGNLDPERERIEKTDKLTPEPSGRLYKWCMRLLFVIAPPTYCLVSQARKGYENSVVQTTLSKASHSVRKSVFGDPWEALVNKIVNTPPLVPPVTPGAGGMPESPNRTP